MYGKQNYGQVSRFLTELGYDAKPKNVEESQGMQMSATFSTNFSGSLNSYMTTNLQQSKAGAGDYVVGDRVFHTKFGIGYITNLQVATNTATIDFDGFGKKTLSLDFAPIKKM